MHSHFLNHFSLQEQISRLEDVPKELLCLYSEGAPLTDDLAVDGLASVSIDVTIPLLGGKFFSLYGPMFDSEYLAVSFARN